jgi:hypothetical protein
MAGVAEQVDGLTVTYEVVTKGATEKSKEVGLLLNLATEDGVEQFKGDLAQDWVRNELVVPSEFEIPVKDTLHTTRSEVSEVPVADGVHEVDMMVGDPVIASEPARSFFVGDHANSTVLQRLERLASRRGPGSGDGGDSDGTSDGVPAPASYDLRGGTTDVLLMKAAHERLGTSKVRANTFDSAQEESHALAYVGVGVGALASIALAGAVLGTRRNVGGAAETAFPSIPTSVTDML